MSRKKSIVEKELSNITIGGKIVMAVMLPIFAVVAGVEHIIAKLTGSIVPLTELPGAVTIVEQLKNNPNPMVRTSAIEALSYIQQPAYKQDLTTLFTIAKNDQDKNVQEAATAALAKLEQMPAEQTTAKEVKMEPKAQQPANAEQTTAKEVKMEQPKQTAQAA